MALKKVYVVKKKQPKCRRNTISTLGDVRNAKIPKVGETIKYNRQELEITKVFSHPKSGPLVEYESSNGDIGTCVAHHWWDKVQEEKDRIAAA